MDNLKSLIVAAIIIMIIIAGGIFLYSRTLPVSINKGTNQAGTATMQQKTGSSQNQSEADITLNKDGFSPATMTVKAGTKVKWTNKSGTTGDVDSNPHPVHTSYPPMNFGQFSDGSSFELIFDKPGTYQYHNHLNPSQEGTIIVQ